MKDDPFKVRVSEHRPKQPLVLTESQLRKIVINSKCGQDSKDEEQARLEEHKQRQEATKALSKLVIQRKEPGSELKKRQYEQAVQSACQELDRDSRIEARRNHVLDLAYKRLYEETDRVKYFKKSKYLAEMLKQRDLQLEAKSNMKDLFYQNEKEFVLGMFRDIDNYAKEEADKIEKKKRDKVKNAENWKKQRDENEKKKKQDEWEHIRDGFIVREAAENYAEEQKRAELKVKEKMQAYKSDLNKQKEDKMILLDINSKLDEADEKRAAIFNEAKRGMTKKHKEIKEELDRQKELKRQHVANNLNDESISLKVKEEAILQNAIRQAEAKHQQECAIKQVKREEALDAIQKFYEEELRVKAKREFEEKRSGYQERRKILENLDEQLQSEDMKRKKKKNAEKDAQHTQLHQIAKRRMDKEAEKVEDRKNFMNHIRSLEDEEEVFQKYAEIEIAECEARGIDTKPMRVAARPGIECGKGPLFKDRGNIRPRYYSGLSKGDELSHVKRNENRPNTKSRLGFLLH